MSSITKRNKCVYPGASMRNILIKGPFKYLNDRLPYPFIWLNLCNPYSLKYLKPEKGTPFGRSLPVWAVIGSTPGAGKQLSLESWGKTSLWQQGSFFPRSDCSIWWQILVPTIQEHLSSLSAKQKDLVPPLLFSVPPQVSLDYNYMQVQYRF